MIHEHGREILVIHPGALGDVLQAVPALRALARNGRLTFSGQPRLGELLRGAGAVQAALSFEGLGLETLFTREPAPSPLLERLARFDSVISWFGSRDETYRERLSALAARCVIASPTPEDGSPVSVWEHLRGTVELPGSPPPADVAPLALPEAWQVDARQVLEDLGVRADTPLLVVHPGAGGKWKLWPAEGLDAVIRRVVAASGFQVLIHQGPADREPAEQLLDLLDASAVRLIEPTLPLLAGVLAHASAYLGADSGVSHLAAAVGAPAVILFPAAFRERWAPWSPTALALGREADAETVAAAISDRRRERPAASRPSSRASP